MRRSTQDVFGETGKPSVAIIGAGFSGIASAVKLKKAGIPFTVYEKAAGPGGTWWDNHYPGAEVDSESYIYSFSFMSNNWSRTHARQKELQTYVEKVIDRFKIRPMFRFNTKVERLGWDDNTHLWTVYTSNGDQRQFNIVISAVGLLNYPLYPDWPGLETFEGPKFHTARWEHEHDLTGKRVALVGTGSTASQVVPAIAPIVGQLYHFQRDPTWVLPKGDRDFTAEERRKFQSDFQRRKRRVKLFLAGAWRSKYGGAAIKGSKANAASQKICQDYIDKVFADRPDLKAAVQPDHPFFGKRMIITSGYLETLLRDNVTVIRRGVVRVTPRGVVDAAGEEHEVDVLVMATGFQPSNFLADFNVVGRGGREIHDVWAGEARAFLGMQMPGFPNFYMLYGPNTNSAFPLSNSERSVEYIIRNIKRMMRRGVTAVEVRRSFYERYDRWLKQQLLRTVWPESKNYYKAVTGAVVTNWPLLGPTEYWLMMRLLRRVSSIDRRRPAPLRSAERSSELKDLVGV